MEKLAANKFQWEPIQPPHYGVDGRLKKFRVLENYHIFLVVVQPAEHIDYGHIHLSSAGVLTIDKGWEWDGPSGTALDTVNSIRASGIHDALCLLMRLKLLPRKMRRKADRIYRRVCKEDGMRRWRRTKQWLGLRLFGWKATKPKGGKG